MLQHLSTIDIILLEYNNYLVQVILDETTQGGHAQPVKPAIKLLSTSNIFFFLGRQLVE